MKHRRKMLSTILMISLIVGLMPAAAFAGGNAGTNRTIMAGASQINGSQGSSVYYGVYPQSKLGTSTPAVGTEGIDWIKDTDAKNNNAMTFYSVDPIKWRVLSDTPNGMKPSDQNSWSEDDGFLLLADQNLDVKQYHTEKETVTWEQSTLRSWLNGYDESKNAGGDSGTSYTENNFISRAFSDAEQKAILETTLENEDTVWSEEGKTGTVEGGENTTDKVFALSITEAGSENYFPEKESSRIATNTAYSEERTDDGIAAGAAEYWWLRSPGDYGNKYAAAVSNKGAIYREPIPVNASFAVRPAFNLNMSAVLFSSAADGGKSANGMDKGLTAVTDYAGNEWKLTLKDQSRNFTADCEVIYTGGKATVSYSGAKTGVNEYISAVIMDKNGYFTYYGRLKKVEYAQSAGGTVEIDLNGITMEDGDTLYLFNEQYNGDKKTDYASTFIEITIPEDENVYDVTYSLSGLSTNGAAYAKKGEDYTAKLSLTDSEHILPDSITVSVNGAPLTAGEKTYTYNAVSGEITIKADAITGTVSISAKSAEKTHQIQAAPTSLNFGSIAKGESVPAAQTVTVTNTGNQSVVLTQPTADYYRIGKLSADRLAPGSSATFTVQPKEDLAVKVYSEKIAITGSNNVNAYVNVGFTVSAATLSAPENIVWDTTVPGKVNWNSVENAAGYTVQLYKNDIKLGSPVSTEEAEYRFAINEAGTYTVKISAKGDGTSYTDSGESESSSLTFYAVSFVSNSTDSIGTQVIVSGGKVTEPKSLSKDGYLFGGWYSDSSFTAASKWDFAENTVSQDITLYAKWTSAGGGSSYIPIIQRPEIITDDGAKASLSGDGSKVTITVNEGYELVDITLNGVSKGTVTELAGLRTGDKVVVTTKKIETEMTLEELKEAMAAINGDDFRARSKLVIMKSGKKAVKVTWYTTCDVDFDGVEIFRSTKRYKGYGKNPFFTTEKDAYYNTAIVKGAKYYYKVRGYVNVDGEKIYTGWSKKAWRTVK